MNKFILTALLIITAVPACCEASYELSHKFLNFGDVKQGKKATEKFTINNTSGNMLDIDRIHLSCSCLKASFRKKQLLPDETMNVSVTFNSEFKDPGQSHYRIFIRTSDHDMPMAHIDAIVYVTSNLARSLSFSPDKIDLHEIDPDDNISADISITNNGKKVYRILSVKGGYAIDIPSYPKTPIEPGQTVKIPVHIKPWIKRGELRTDVTIETDDPLMPQFFCPVIAEVEYKKR